MNRRVLVIGGGISGLAAGVAAGRAGADVSVIDKGRGPGGRLATRRVGDGRDREGVFDYGAQYFTVRSPVFEPWVRAWEKAGVVRVWTRGFAEAHGGIRQTLEPRYRGRGGLRDIARHLAGELNVAQGTRAVVLSWSNGCWRVEDETGAVREADVVILTPPVPQTLALLYESRISLPSDVAHGLLRVSYRPCIALLVLLDGESAVPSPGGVWLNGEPLAWVADNRLKGISPGATAVTVLAGHAFSRGHWDGSEESVRDAMLSAAAPWLASQTLSCTVHRWRYSRPEHTYPAPFVALSDPGPLIIAGDGFGGGRLEGAFLSGVSAGTYVGSLLHE